MVPPLAGSPGSKRRSRYSSTRSISSWARSAAPASTSSAPISCGTTTGRATADTLPRSSRESAQPSCRALAEHQEADQREVDQVEENSGGEGGRVKPEFVVHRPGEP